MVAHVYDPWGLERDPKKKQKNQKITPVVQHADAQRIHLQQICVNGVVQIHPRRSSNRQKFLKKGGSL